MSGLAGLDSNSDPDPDFSWDGGGSANPHREAGPVSPDLQSERQGAQVCAQGAAGAAAVRPVCLLAALRVAFMTVDTHCAWTCLFTKGVPLSLLPTSAAPCEGSCCACGTARTRTVRSGTLRRAGSAGWQVAWPGPARPRSQGDS